MLKTECNEAVPIAGFEAYSIDKDGNVYNKSGKMMRQEKSSNGYLRVTLSNGKRKRFLVHRLVASAFIPNPENKKQVNHKDKCRTNNRVDNLEWVTPLENLNHSEVIQKASKANEQKIICTTTGNVYNSIKEVEALLGLYHSNLVACCMGRRKHCGGMKWEYVNQ